MCNTDNIFHWPTSCHGVIVHVSDEDVAVRYYDKKNDSREMNYSRQEFPIKDPKVGLNFNVLVQLEVFEPVRKDFSEETLRLLKLVDEKRGNPPLEI